jgi:hypothetical protein
MRLATLSLGMNRNDSRDLRENKRREYQGSQQRFHVLSSEVAPALVSCPSTLRSNPHRDSAYRSL